MRVYLVLENFMPVYLVLEIKGILIVLNDLGTKFTELSYCFKVTKSLL
jgi:hypothetical protein